MRCVADDRSGRCGSMAGMRVLAARRGAKAVPALATLSWVVLSSCTGGGTPGTAHFSAASPSQRLASGRTATGPIGSPGNPLVLSCGQESFSDPPPPQHPRPADLAVGPLYFVNGNRLPTVSPAGYSDHGSWKIPLVLAMGASAMVEIAPPAQGHVVISNPYSLVGGVVAAIYRSCAYKAGFFAQSFSFLHGETRGCVPLDVSIGTERQVRHVTISLAAGSCASRPESAPRIPESLASLTAVDCAANRGRATNRGSLTRRVAGGSLTPGSHRTAGTRQSRSCHLK